ncbi:MAG TPA: M3 family metallopeptidase [Kofleriaceae bacterium]|nr:M3 family metallopeptidase [Kofleriaceae bacterium]
MNGTEELQALLAPWVGAHGGFPRFKGVDAEVLRAALHEGMRLTRAEIAAIANQEAPATFDNTIAALEDSGRAFGRVTAVFGIYRSTMNDAAMQQLEEEMAPILSAFSDEITQNAKLFARISSVHAARHGAALDAEQLRLVEVVYQRYARHGAALAPEGKARLAEINARLASLYTRFSQNVLADEEGQLLVLEHQDDLAGLPDSLIAGARETAAAKQLAGKWAIGNTRSAMEPFLTFAARRDLRERGWRMWVGRGEQPGDHDNRPVITEILRLRQEKAGLLGFPSHAHWIISDNMAKDPATAMALLQKVWPAAVAQVKVDVAQMQQLAEADAPGLRLEPWDYRYYAERLRQAKYALDQNEIKAYLVLDQICAAMMWAAEQLYGLSFVQVADVPVVHPEVTVYEVKRGADHVGLWYFDPYARDGKISGAWMSEYRTQERFRDALAPIVSNNSNFVRAEGAVLISWDDARTLFHEMGHALHGLLSSVRYPTLAGTNVKRDFVELPSQLNEHWLHTPELLGRFARHHQTGEPMPSELVAKLERAKHANEGFRTVEYLSAAIYDLAIHTAPAAEGIDPIAFEAHLMQEIGMPPQIVMRHRPPQFSHIFSNDEYSAGYYAYLWADTLTADAAEAFSEAGSFYDAATARALREQIMSVGNTVDPELAYRAFRGRAADSDALMRDRGFAPARS